MSYKILHKYSNYHQMNRPDKNSRIIVNVYEWVEALITSLIAVVIVFTFIFRVVNVSGPSMLPTLKSNDRVILNSMFYKPQNGDVVVITHTNKLKEPIIKRIIALENQVVDIDLNSGTVKVDGVELDESEYIQNEITNQPTDYEFPLKVPKGHVFVLGDNRPISCDSRYSDVGMIDEKYILGKAEIIVFQFNRIGKIK